MYDRHCYYYAFDDKILGNKKNWPVRGNWLNKFTYGCWREYM